MSRVALVTGATGLLGRKVVQSFSDKSWTVKGTGWSRADGRDILKLDLTDSDAISQTISEVKPSVVVHSAANKYPDSVDKDPDAARALNVSATQALASTCAAQDILLIYISTDYVFPGRPGQAPYRPSDPTDPPNLYGRLKRDGEDVVLDEFSRAGRPGRGVVLRVPVLYGSAESPAESAVNVLMETVEKAQGLEGGRKIKMDHWAVRYPTNTEDVGRVCHDVAVRYLDGGAGADVPRILHFSSEDRFTKYEMCELFADIMGYPMDNIEANTEGNDPKSTAQRPYDCHLSTEALTGLGISVATCDFKGWWRREVGAFRK